MPIYAYKCSACDHAEDKLQKISDAPLSVCPQCGQSTYSKQVTAAGFQLKGSGWYVTDFRSNGSGGAKTSEAAVPVAGSEAAAGASGGDGKAAGSGDSSASQAGSSSESSGNKSSGASSSGTSGSSSGSAPASGSGAASSGNSGASASSGGSSSTPSGNT